MGVIVLCSLSLFHAAAQYWEAGGQQPLPFAIGSTHYGIVPHYAAEIEGQLPSAQMEHQDPQYDHQGALITPAMKRLSQEIFQMGRQLDWRGALQKFQAMQQKGIVPITGCYNALLCALDKSKQMQSAIPIFESMWSYGVVPDAYTYNIMIASAGRHGFIDHQTPC
eukprot:gnl/TRDRNA2_/TRDRNA2_129455_c0_seq2.p1 gnl/TRDRNA2_/TRDRNA2_129455_c0~~gnl/TRDRNA2_/TRDRNA2_129455_c0_seq2.p1  ORF type:complete len:166 (-),score=10.06 gnl/TRDRNA2_/TRDRNA2_129455_c0_seq2:2-499(-)